MSRRGGECLREGWGFLEEVWKWIGRNEAEVLSREEDRQVGQRGNTGASKAVAQLKQPDSGITQTCQILIPPLSSCTNSNIIGTYKCQEFITIVIVSFKFR